MKDKDVTTYYAVETQCRDGSWREYFLRLKTPEEAAEWVKELKEANPGLNRRVIHKKVTTIHETQVVETYDAEELE